MELKVWVEGVVRVVSGLSLNTSCQDVVIALAQAIGQTGRYILILKLRGNERQLVADDCPLQHLAKLGQLAQEVQFVLRRTGPSLSEGQNTPSRERRLPLPRPPEPEPLKHRDTHKALSFSLGPSTHPKRTKPNRAWSPSPRASPEPRASPVSFLDAPSSVKAVSSYSSKEEVFRQILQQQRRLQDLEIQLQALERETEVWERERSSATVPSLNLHLADELEELEQQLRQNEAELMHRAHWEEQLQAEMDREQDMHRRLHQIHSVINEHSYQIQELQARSAHVAQDIQLTAQRQTSQQQEEALRPLRQELHNRLQQGDELETTLSQTQRELQAAEEIQQDRCEVIEELNKELRQCNLQQFIQQTGGPNSDQTNSLPVTEVYLSNAGIME
ncbi:ras association domain-containing protein 7 [Lates calcarifer]|uniref:Ras association domain-containing protein 7 n=1 Tax=Lates calcarifer TaxID=8187 RepID=A0AAJ7Q7A6_LATCA|nr:ras association domain-containing protein 7 [Lates calcarifer]XP_018548304.1 ras association domain-containing protein 7 [Lates calcarifer]XP_018548578.1 ras association domain-containing protein 7 [Lates calcarifer]XP_018548579.1 ras association domain-containing protein 7 [Lates calcarifer]